MDIYDEIYPSQGYEWSKQLATFSESAEQMAFNAKYATVEYDEDVNMEMEKSTNNQYCPLCDLSSHLTSSTTALLEIDGLMQSMIVRCTCKQLIEQFSGNSYLGAIMNPWYSSPHAIFTCDPGCQCEANMAETEAYSDEQTMGDTDGHNQSSNKR